MHDRSRRFPQDDIAVDGWRLLGVIACLASAVVVILACAAVVL